MTTEFLTVQIERVTYTNAQNGYSVLKATSKGFRELITLVGVFANIHPGEELRVTGTWACHPQFGQQFHVQHYSTLKPATLKGIEKYLGSGLIKGVGPVTAKRLVAQFHEQTLEIIEHQPELLTSCPGIGSFRAEKIISGWQQQKAIQDVMVFLQGHGISTAYAVRIFKHFGGEAVKKVADNPYLLAYEIRGIGFKTADKIAAEFGISGADPRRLEAGVLYVLSQHLDEGHLFLPLKLLVDKSRDMLGIEQVSDIETAIESQIAAGRATSRTFRDQRLIYLPFAYRHEQGCVDQLSRRLDTSPSLARERLLALLAQVEARSNLSLSEQQKLAVEKSLRTRLLVITGGPGTGKTTTLNSLVQAHRLAGREVALASPTGRAAKRLSEVTGLEAKTIHRLLEFDPSRGAFKHDAKNPLQCQTLVIDEASMLDQELFHGVLKALPPQTSLLLVGDVDQLPSVGAGLVLKSLIDSGVIPVVRLDTIFRQAQGSLIIANAHKINTGRFPHLQEPDGKTQTDFYFLEHDDKEKLIAQLKLVLTSSLPKKFGYHPIHDIQVLTPLNRGPLGATLLNQVLQEALNPAAPDKPELTHMNRRFRAGDKVLQTRNNYDLEVFNGDVGIIRQVEPEDQELVIEFPQGERVFQNADLLDLTHAFAMSVHKSQGSEYPGVVLLLTNSHYVMLQRNLLYTGVTRARKTLVIMGTKQAIALAVKNNRTIHRYTIFSELLQEAFATRRTSDNPSAKPGMATGPGGFRESSSDFAEANDQTVVE
ncbi:MAG TPA: ATP-dependent RecD-like DNA helicase [Candidatus Ozemobacteraceae bacterium]|nr:ATP-dependent RecD-like DNA helicase [Candidatus Ozemobacteraceae bacterium]